MAIRSYKRMGEMPAEVRRIIDRELDSHIKRLMTAGKRAVKNIASETIMSWYAYNGLSSGKTVAESINTEARILRTTQDKVTIAITLSADTSVLDSTGKNFPDAVRWANNHNNIAMPWGTGTYIFYLRWATGALALPERAHFTGSGWVNSSFMFSSMGTMQEYVYSTIQKRFMGTVQQLIRGRNTAMGAGINSTGREAGLANLDLHRKR